MLRHGLLLVFGFLILAANAVAQLGGEAVPAVKPLATFKLPDWGTSVAFSPDGRTLAIGTYEKVLLAGAESAKVERELKVSAGFARGVAWSPDGTKLATACSQAVQIWPADGDKASLRLKVRGYANDVAFSPDGTQVAAACEDKTVRIWNAGDGAEQRTLEGFDDPVQAVAFSPDGSRIAAVAGDETRLTRGGSVLVWTVADGQPAQGPAIPPEKGATDVAFSPDGTVLFVADLNKRVTLYDVETGEAKGFFGKHGRPVNSVVPLKDGKTLASGSGGLAEGKNEIRLWTAEDGEELATLEPHAAKVTRIAVSPDETRLAAVSFDKTATLWDLPKLRTGAPSPSKDIDVAQKLKDALAAIQPDENATPRTIRVGIIGLDTSHSIAFTKAINEAKEPPLGLCRVVAAYPNGSADIESSVSRIPGYSKEIQGMGVEIVESIDKLLDQVDCVLLETNDGRPHLDQALQVLKAGKPVFVDKPVAASLSDTIAIFEAAKHYRTPVFSSSSLRYAKGAQAARNGELGAILGCDAYSPCHLEATHPDLYWYGIHGVESLFTVMGTGCQSVSRASSADFDVAVGTWADGRIGTFRGIRKGAGGYGGTIFSEKSVTPIGDYGGYEPLVVQITEFFKTGKPPVSAEETIEIYAFMSAADLSKQKNGEAISLESVLTPAREAAKKALADRSIPAGERAGR